MSNDRLCSIWNKFLKFIQSILQSSYVKQSVIPFFDPIANMHIISWRSVLSLIFLFTFLLAFAAGDEAAAQMTVSPMGDAQMAVDQGMKDGMSPEDVEEFQQLQEKLRQLEETLMKKQKDLEKIVDALQNNEELIKRMKQNAANKAQ